VSVSNMVDLFNGATSFNANIARWNVRPVCLARGCSPTAYGACSVPCVDRLGACAACGAVLVVVSSEVRLDLLAWPTDDAPCTCPS
jgi:DNA primase large subunit